MSKGITITETQLKRQVKDYLNAKGIFNFHITQGIACYKGIPDKIYHYRGEVIYLELKREGGKLSEYQKEFQRQCALDGIKYFVIRNLDELIEKLT